MKKISPCFLIIASFLSLLARPAAGQNAVRMAAALYRVEGKIQRYPKPHAPGYIADTVIARSLRFFRVLAANDPQPNATPMGLLTKYRSNPFLAPAVQLVYNRFDEALIYKRVKVEEDLKTGTAGTDIITLQEQLRAGLLDTLGRQLAHNPKPDSVLRSQGCWPDLYRACFATKPGGLLVEFPAHWPDSTLAIARRTVSAYLKATGKLNEPAVQLPSTLFPVSPKADDFAGNVMAALQGCLSTAQRKGLNEQYSKLGQAYATVAAAVAKAKKEERVLVQMRATELLGTLEKEKAVRGKEVHYEVSLLPSISLPLASASLTKTPSAGAAASLEGAVIDGAARFLADRLKQELNATFFQHFATLLHDSAYVELQVLFPSTARLLTSGSADYSTIVQTLRGTFERDLRELLFNYGDLLKRQRFYADRVSPDACRMLHYSFASSRALYYLTHGVHPAGLLERLETDLVVMPSNDALNQTLRLSKIFAGTLLDEISLNRQWPSLQQLGDSLRTPAVREQFLGLVWERAKPLLAPQYQQPAEFQQLAVAFVTLSGQLQDQATALRDQASRGRLRADEFVPIYQTLQRSLEWAVTYGGPVANRQARLEKLALYRGIGDALLQGYVAADKGDYGVTLSNFLDIVLRTLGPAEAAAATASATTTASSAGQALNQLPQLAHTQLLSLPQIVRYGSFMAAIAQAKTSGDVKDALEAAALPVGSASIKRRSFSSISVNAFVGITGGAEWAYLTKAQPGNNIDDINSLKPNVGPTAPIGLSFAWGRQGYVQPLRLRALAPPTGILIPWRHRMRAARLRRLDQAYRYYDTEGKEKFLRGSALGVFVSVLDLGVPVLLRFNDDKATTIPNNIGFRQVLAPGVFGFYHLQGVPLSLFAGAQYTPQLRELSQLTVPAGAPADLPFRNSMRFNVGLTVDIPLFQLFTRTEQQGDSPRRQLVEQQAQHDAAELAEYKALQLLPEAKVKSLEKELAALQLQIKGFYDRTENGDFVKAAPTLSNDITTWVAEAKTAVAAHDWRKLARLRADMSQAVEVAKMRALAYQQDQQAKAIKSNYGAKVVVPPPTFPLFVLPVAPPKRIGPAGLAPTGKAPSDAAQPAPADIPASPK
jgi:hypothetical protein